ncbi:uncharacterized protein Dana_GF19475, isoform A [Drosophila ananassae]|uniref:Uncharacterized protein, isoform A n=1 Tax=Drosophila ananassae TaxID=7217 RepID=B3MXH4_DROAN|nr:histone-lysine N-methyltransferase trr [Drosophila ananassae]EDV38439.1 uncharacterized protein Dana_GF19475, isoform A [Drosophila ananassae]
MNISKVTTSLGGAEKAKPATSATAVVVAAGSGSATVGGSGATAGGGAGAGAAPIFNAVSIQKRSSAEDTAEDSTAARKKQKTTELIIAKSATTSNPTQQLLYQLKPKNASDQADNQQQEDATVWTSGDQQQIILCNFGEMSAIKSQDESEKQTFSFTKKEAGSSSSSSSSTASILSLEPSGSGQDPGDSQPVGKTEDLDFVLMPAASADNSTASVSSGGGSSSGIASTIILNANNGGTTTTTGVAGTTTTILTQKAGQANFNIFNATTATGSQTPTTTILNRMNLQSKMKTTQLVVNAKKLSEVTQTTAKVSIGNKTISVPLLKPLMSASGVATAGGATIVESKQLLQAAGGQVTANAVVSAAGVAAGQQVHAHGHPQARQHHNFTNLIKRGPKNPATIVSFSGLQIKPATTKIVAAKVVSKKMSLQLQQQQLQQQHTQQQLQVTSGASLAPATGSIVTITTTNPSQTYAMVQDAAAGAGAGTNSSSMAEDESPAPRKITYNTENIHKILNKSKNQDQTEPEFANINSVVIKPLDKTTLNCPTSFNIFKQQQQAVTVAAAAAQQGNQNQTPATSSAASDLSSASTVSVSAVCINSPVMGSRPIISFTNNKNISLVLSKTTMAQQKPKMITTTTMATMHQALNQDSANDKGTVAVAVGGGGAASAPPMQLKLTPTKLSVSLTASQPSGVGGQEAKLEEIVAGEPKVKLLVKQEVPVAVVKSREATTPTAQDTEPESTPEKQRLNASTTLTPISQVPGPPVGVGSTSAPQASTSNPSTPNSNPATPQNTHNSQRPGADESNNALLKQLLQNTSNSHSLNQINITSAHVANSGTNPPMSAHVANAAGSAPLSARKVNNVRAPCLGPAPSSLEAQLARPVKPPLPTATPGSSTTSGSGTTASANSSSSSSAPVATSTSTTTVAGAGSSSVSVAGTVVAPVPATTPGPSATTVGEAKMEQKPEAPVVVNQNQVPPPPPPPQQQQQHLPVQPPVQPAQASQPVQPPAHPVTKQTVQIVSKETSFISGPPKSVQEANPKPTELLPPPPYELATAPVSNVTISISTKQPAAKELQMKPKAVAMSLPMEQGDESLPEQADQPPNQEHGATPAPPGAPATAAAATVPWSNSNHLEAGVGATKIPFKPGEAQKRKLPMHPQLEEKQLQVQLQQLVDPGQVTPGTPTPDKVHLISSVLTGYVKKPGTGGETTIQAVPSQSQGQVQMQAQMQAAMQGQLQGQIPGQLAGQMPNQIQGQIPAQMQIQVQQQQHHQQQQQQHPQQQVHQQHQVLQVGQVPGQVAMGQVGGGVPSAMPVETKAVDQRKRRKREVQKPRRTNLNAAQTAAGVLKDMTGTLPAGAMVQLTGMPPGTHYIQGGSNSVISNAGSGGVTPGGVGSAASASPMMKKRVRKLSKVEEDHDAFTEKLLTHIRQMQPLQVLEPHLNRNFHFLMGSNETASTPPAGSSGSGGGAAAGSSAGSGGGKVKGSTLNARGWPLGRHLEGLEDCDSATLGRYGRVRIPGIPSLYDSDRFGGSGGLVGGSAATRSPSPSLSPGGSDKNSLPLSSIQNDFYDQEFSTHIERNPRERLLRHIGAVRDCNLETVELVESDSVAAWAALPRVTRYPGLVLLNGNSRCHGRMSPVAQPEDPITMRVPVSPLIRSCGEELRKSQQLELGTGSNNNNNNNYQQKNQNVILSLPASSGSSDNIAGVLRDLANLLHLAPSLTCKILDGDKVQVGSEKLLLEADQEDNKDDFKRPLNISHGHLRKILNGRRKLCRSCGNVVHASGLRVPRHSLPALEEQLPRLAQLMAMLPKKPIPAPFVYFCDRSCFAHFKWSAGKESQAEAASLLLQPAGGACASSTSSSASVSATASASESPSPALAETVVKQEPEDESEMKHPGIPGTPIQRKCIVKCFSADCFGRDTAPTLDFDETGRVAGTGTGAANNTVWETDAGSQQLEDTRQCVFCNQRGDGQADGPSRLLNFDVDKWVHLNCALWSNGVYETVSGALMNFQTALQAGLNQTCSACHQLGATIKCFKSRCNSLYHLPCAIREECVFYKNKSVHCSAHGHPHGIGIGGAGGGGAGNSSGGGGGGLASGAGSENELSSLVVHRRVFVDRDENRQVATVMHYSELSNLLRVGNMTFLNVGQLLPHQLEAFHTPHYIYPIGYKVSRYYWCVRQPNRRCRYICSIAEAGCKPEFRILVQDAGDKEPEREFRDSSPTAVWQQILQPITRLRKVHKWLQLFPQHISGEDLFGLTEPAIVRILESLPGIETLTDYRFKYGRNPLLEFPLAINPSGAARTEPKQRQLLVWRKPHTQRTAGSCSTQRMANSAAIAGEVACPYSKQFVHSKSSQYKKMKQEWRNNVYLARSKIQGLGLYAARDIEKHTMIIEYIGEVIRTEVSEIREKQYESKNRGIYMFRLDEDRVVDATLSGGLARYINHSCNPNCVTEIVEVDRDVRIIIFAKRKIYRGEELSYDYKFDIEDDAHKIPCACGAPNCRKWMN